MEPRCESPKRELLRQRRRKVPGSSGSHEATELERMREDESLLVRSSQPPARNSRALSPSGGPVLRKGSQRLYIQSRALGVGCLDAISKRVWIGRGGLQPRRNAR